jgi:hypothetical protein
MDRYTESIAKAQIENAINNNQNIELLDSIYVNKLRNSTDLQQVFNGVLNNSLNSKNLEIQALCHLDIMRSLLVLSTKIDSIESPTIVDKVYLSKVYNCIEDEFNNQAILFGQLTKPYFQNNGRTALGNYKIAEAVESGYNVFLVSTDDDIKYSLVDKYGDKLISYKKIAQMESQGINPWTSRDYGVVAIIDLINHENPPTPEQYPILVELYPHLTFRNVVEEQRVAKQQELQKQQAWKAQQKAAEDQRTHILKIAEEEKKRAENFKLKAKRDAEQKVKDEKSHRKNQEISKFGMYFTLLSLLSWIGFLTANSIFSSTNTSGNLQGYQNVLAVKTFIGAPIFLISCAIGFGAFVVFIHLCYRDSQRLT